VPREIPAEKTTFIGFGQLRRSKALAHRKKIRRRRLQIAQQRDFEIELQKAIPDFARIANCFFNLDS